MERPHLRSIGINEFLRWNNEGVLVLSPKFQRRRIWPMKAKAYLIDTILRGLPIPKLYMRQHLNLKSTKTVHEVVDGQQRIAAVLDFYAGKFKLSPDDSSYGRIGYSELPAEAQRQFLKYEFSVDVLIDAADADVLDIFARINSYSVPLNAQEKRNAKFFGTFKRTVYSVALEHLEFWKRHKILTDATIARMREAELTSEIMIGMISGLQDKKSSIDGFYESWDDKFPHRTAAVNRFHDIVNLLDRFFGETLANTKFHRPTLFYSLFLALYELRYHAIGDIEGSKKQIGESQGKKMQEALLRLDNVLGMAEPPKKYIRFVTACQRQTDNIQPRRTRHETLLAEFS